MPPWRGADTSKYGQPMNLYRITRFLNTLDESIDIHGLQKRFKENPKAKQVEIEGAVKTYRSTLQARKKEVLAPYGLDDLDKFKDDPLGFARAVQDAVYDFAVEKEGKSLYRRVYEDERCLITMPKGSRGAAAAGSLCKVNGRPACPWCVAVRYPDNRKHWAEYDAETLFFVYAKEGGVPVNAWCMLLTLADCRECLYGAFSVSDIEDLANSGDGDDEEVKKGRLEDIAEQTGMDESALCRVFAEALQPMKAKLEREEGPEDGLFRAIRHGWKDKVQGYLDSGVSLDIFDNDEDRTPLSMAAAHGHPDICRMLLDAGADVNAKDGYGAFTPLLAAIRAGSADCVRVLLAAGADPLLEDKDGNPALHTSVAFDRQDVLALLLDAGLDVDARNRRGDTPLSVAAFRGRVEICKTLLDAGAGVDSANRDGKTPLFSAVANGHHDVCGMLLKAGADVEAVDKSGNTPLISAAENGFAPVCQTLLDAGADIEARTAGGATPLLLASPKSSMVTWFKTCKVLVDAGADVNAADEMGMTPLIYAAYAGACGFCKILLDAGADADAKCKLGSTALSFAKAMGRKDVEELLGGG